MYFQPLVLETGKPRVLFVDDELGVLHALVRVFRTEAVEVHTAASANAALALLAAHDVQVVVSDHHLGDAEGVALLGRIHAHHPAIVRLLLSGDSELEDARDALGAAGIRLLAKPWCDTELRSAVHQALALAAQQRSCA